MHAGEKRLSPTLRSFSKSVSLHSTVEIKTKNVICCFCHYCIFHDTFIVIFIKSENSLVESVSKISRIYQKWEQIFFWSLLFAYLNAWSGQSAPSHQVLRLLMLIGDLGDLRVFSRLVYSKFERPPAHNLHWPFLGIDFVTNWIMSTAKKLVCKTLWK